VSYVASDVDVIFADDYRRDDGEQVDLRDRPVWAKEDIQHLLAK
jgi:hypothetical protein